MTRLFRVDPRFVHATLMNAWVPFTGAKRIVIADDRALQDPRLKKILEMSTMDLVKLVFVGEEDLAKLLAAEPRDQSLIVLFGTLAAARRAIEAGAPVDALNIGHIPESPERKPVLPAVHLGPADLEIIKALTARGVKVYLQPLPRDPPSSAFAAPEIPQPIARKDPAVALSRREPTPLPRPPAVEKPVEKERVEEKLRVLNERGLHLRAAHAFAHLAGSLPQDVQVGLRGEFVNAKSLLGLTTLGATCGTKLDVIVTGRDAKTAMEDIRELFASGFDEGVAWVEGAPEDDG